MVDQLEEVQAEAEPMTSTVETTGTRPRLWTGDYLRWLVSDTSGALAAGLHSIATPLLAFLITGSATLAGVIGALTSTAVVLGTLPAGVLADRLHRRALMSAGALANATTLTVGVALYLAGGLNGTTLGAVAILIAIVSAFTASATNAALRQVVDRERLAQAMSVNQARDSAIALGAGPAAGALFAVAPVLPWIVALVCETTKALTSRTISDPLAPGGTESRPRLLRDLATGFLVVKNNNLLRSLVSIAALLNFAGSGILLALILGMQKDGVNAAVIGSTMTAIGVGSLVGAALTPMLINRVRTGTLLAVCFTTEALALTAIAFAPGPRWTLACLTVAFVAVPMINAACSGFIMALTPTHLQGRVGSTVATASLSATPLASLTAGWGVENVGTSSIVLAFAGIFVLSLVMTLAARSVRSIPKPADWEEHAAAQRGPEFDA